ncbi:2Fe-2S iron-sulfur cluster-binding protein [Bdellovibrio sp. HCB274]|uniref:2Fe-2S iron-sulfur cluster-binding protein n=1 Tax=Bdellovibrio sp. HCB274 TaxID=3394361 RepID=UPI0039B49586
MKIKFLPQNIEVEGTPDKSLLQIATENKLEIRSICKGVPSCAECRVRIKEGDNNVLPPGKAELSLIGTSYFIDGRRLSCQVRCFGDVTVDLTEQVDRAENQTKKIRGFRTSKQMESKAVNDTMLLDAKVDEAAAAAAGSSTTEVGSEATGAPQSERPQQQQGRNQNQQQHQHKQKQNQQNQNRQKQGGGQQGQQQKQQQQAKQQQPKPQNAQNQQKQQQKQKGGGGGQNQNRQHNQPNQQKQQNQNQQQARPQNQQNNQNQNKPKQ